MSNLGSGSGAGGAWGLAAATDGRAGVASEHHAGFVSDAGSVVRRRRPVPSTW